MSKRIQLMTSFVHGAGLTFDTPPRRLLRQLAYAFICFARAKRSLLRQKAGACFSDFGARASQSWHTSSAGQNWHARYTEVTFKSLRARAPSSNPSRSIISAMLRNRRAALSNIELAFALIPRIKNAPTLREMAIAIVTTNSEIHILRSPPLH